MEVIASLDTNSALAFEKRLSGSCGNFGFGPHLEQAFRLSSGVTSIHSVLFESFWLGSVC
jgi:hypothetical protein